MKRSFKLPTLLAALSIIALTWVLNTPAPTTEDLSKSSVMISRPNKRSGGTGVILESTESVSTILTNAHVCKLAKTGPTIASTHIGDFSIKRYYSSDEYDLCLVQVDKNLGINTKVARTAPKHLSKATIVGHPALYPTVVSEGHFSELRTIPIMVGIRKCEAKDWNANGMLCLFLGGIPIIKNYESILVTATIMPGSSGSAVYNAKGELSAVVFAGRGELGYAWAMPHEAVSRFLDSARGGAFYTEASNTIDYGALEESRKIRGVVESCKMASGMPLEVRDVCDLATYTPIVQ